MIHRVLFIGALSVALIGCAGRHHHPDGPRLVSLSVQVPAPVAATIQREAQGGPIVSIERELKPRGPEFEATALIGGKPYEIKVAPDGTLISKELERPGKEMGGREDGPCPMCPMQGMREGRGMPPMGPMGQRPGMRGGPEMPPPPMPRFEPRGPRDDREMDRDAERQMDRKHGKGDKEEDDKDEDEKGKDKAKEKGKEKKKDKGDEK